MATRTAEGTLSTELPDGPAGGPAAVLWDMDGTLVDTEPYWMDTEFELAAAYGATWTHEDGLSLVGNDLLVSGRMYQEITGVPLSPEEIRDRLLDGVVARIQHEVPWRPGARELLAALNEAGVPCALVTMSYRRFAQPVVDALPAGSFQALVVGDEVDRGKPHPEPYLAAARALDVRAEDCLAIEDSNTGAASAAAAGCTVMCVPNHVPIENGPRRILVPTLEGLTPADLPVVG